MRCATKFTRSSSWIEELVTGMAVGAGQSRSENSMRLSDDLPDDFRPGHFEVHARRNRRYPDNCSARLVWVDEDGTSWNLIRCNGAGGHSAHRNLGDKGPLFGGRSGIPVVPHVHHLRVATLERLAPEQYPSAHDNFAIFGLTCQWTTIEEALLAVARRGKIRVRPESLFDPYLRLNRLP